MTQHTLVAEIERTFTFPGLAPGEREVAYPKIAITFAYSPAFTPPIPRGEYAPIDPPEPAEVQLVKAELVDGDGLSPTIGELHEWAADWLDGEGFNEAVNFAESDGPDPSDLFKAKRDDDDFAAQFPRLEDDYD